eukprot:3922031-Pleurochrysis_carterae.AAC.1
MLNAARYSNEASYNHSAVSALAADTCLCDAICLAAASSLQGALIHLCGGGGGQAGVSTVRSVGAA